MTLDIYDEADTDWVIRSVPMKRDAHGVWTGRSRTLAPGRAYAIRVNGPRDPQSSFDERRPLLDPYARGVARASGGSWRSVVVERRFDWGQSRKPLTPLEHTVIYEMHVRGFSRANPAVPAELRGSYAGLAHPASIDYLRHLGITTVELLPVHAFVSEQRLVKQGLTNYWGYNTLAFFAPHPAYASRAAQVAGPDAVLREFKGMVKLLHEAGIEVILDVVYNHTAEEGRDGPVFSFRGIDNANYYRQDAHGQYVDTTGCGNTVDFGRTVPVRMVLDSMRYWAAEVHIDGFRLDLAATLGRDGHHGEFRADHPLLRGMLADPVIGSTKLIAEPWDVGPGGWQTGSFPDGFAEWNDRYRDRMRDFWLSDTRRERETGDAASGIGKFATRLAGSSNTFSAERGPLASVNFITAHDGFTLADLTAYDGKHNLGNGEDNRDGTDDNNSYNFGVEGPTLDEAITSTRRRAIRNLLGTLLFSAGIPMLTAGDEYGKSQRGNNNAYCHDSELTWLSWVRDEWQVALVEIVRELIRLRRDNPALRPKRYGVSGTAVPGASQMDWYNVAGETMTIDAWNDPAQRTLQYLVTSTPEDEPFNRVLLIVHGREQPIEVTLPSHADVTDYELLWDSSLETRIDNSMHHAPLDRVRIEPSSMQLFRAR